MDHQQHAEDTKTHTLDSSSLVIQDCNKKDNFSMVNGNKWNMHSSMSSKEMKIRGELEMDIERDLEQEIKDGIYRLALRLHQLYQRQNERNTRETSESDMKNYKDRKKKLVAEVNISIKLEGGTKIEIKETKKQVPEKVGRPMTAKSDDYRGANVCEKNKYLNWSKSLRANSGSIAINNRNDQMGKMASNVRGQHMNLDRDINGGRTNLTSAAGQRKENVNLDNKALEMGWKY